MGRSEDTLKGQRHRTTLEAPLRPLAGAFIAIAIALFALAVVLCRIDLDGGRSFFYTNEYRRLSEAPYTASALRSRGFVPFIAWSLGLGGQRYPFFSLLVTLAFLLATAVYLWRATGRVSVAFVGTMLITSLPVTEFGVFALGWPDQFCGLMFILTLIIPPAGILLSIAALLAHEFSIALLLTSIVMIPRPRLWRAIHLVIPIGIIWCSKSAFNFPPDGALGVLPIIRGFIADPGGQITRQPVILGFLSALKVFTLLIPFAFYRAWRSRSFDAWTIAFSLALTFGCLTLAHDSTRIWGLALPAILVTIRNLSQHHLLLALACIANVLLPSYSFSSAWRAHLDRSFGWVELAYRALAHGIAW